MAISGSPLSNPCLSLPPAQDMQPGSMQVEWGQCRRWGGSEVMRAQNAGGFRGHGGSGQQGSVHSGSQSMEGLRV